MTAAQAEDFRKKGYSQSDIDRISILEANSPMTYEDIEKKLEKGSTLDQLEKKLFRGGAEK